MQTRGRVLGIDAGERRVGLAVSDELGLVARPVGVVQGAGRRAALVEQVAAVARREDAARVVVGLPLNEDGTEGRQAGRARAFAALVARALRLPVELWDERLTTVAAEAAIRVQGRSTRTARRRGSIDAVAAAAILQDYLDAQHRERARRSRAVS